MATRPAKIAISFQVPNILVFKIFPKILLIQLNLPKKNSPKENTTLPTKIQDKNL